MWSREQEKLTQICHMKLRRQILPCPKIHGEQHAAWSPPLRFHPMRNYRPTGSHFSSSSGGVLSGKESEVQRRMIPVSLTGREEHSVDRTAPPCAAFMNTAGNTKAKCDFLRDTIMSVLRHRPRQCYQSRASAAITSVYIIFPLDCLWMFWTGAFAVSSLSHSSPWFKGALWSFFHAGKQKSRFTFSVTQQKPLSASPRCHKCELPADSLLQMLAVSTTCRSVRSRDITGRSVCFPTNHTEMQTGTWKTPQFTFKDQVYNLSSLP